MDFWAIVISAVGVIAGVVSAIYAVLHYRHDQNISTVQALPNDEVSGTPDNESLFKNEFDVVNEVRTAFRVRPPRPAIVQILESAIDTLFKIDHEGYGGFTVRNFDWDGNSTILRPCDVHLGYDKWDISSGTHLEKFELSEESFATLYSVLLVGGVLFGNGYTVIFKPKYKPREILPIKLAASEYGFGVTRDRKVLVAFPEDRSKIAILSTEYSGKFQLEIIDTILSKDSYSERAIYFSPFQGDNCCFYVLQQQSSMENLPEQTITRHDFKSRQPTSSKRIKGLQHIALHPDGSNLVVVCTDHIDRIDPISLSIIDQMPLTAPREHEKYVQPPVQFSPCGSYLALCYAISGEIEIRNASTLEILTKISTFGLPAAPLEWSSDGQLLAGGFRRRVDGKSQLFIWSIPNTKCLATVENVLLFSPSRPYCSSVVLQIK
jgi:WD40 repeat protein